MTNNIINASNTQYGTVVFNGSSFNLESPGPTGKVFTSSGSNHLPQFKTFPGLNQVLVSSQTASTSASIIFNNLPTGYASFLLTWSNVVADTSTDVLYLNFSANNGSSFTSFIDANVFYSLYNSSSYTNSYSPTQLLLTSGLNTTNTANGYIYVYNINVAVSCHVCGQGAWYDNTNSATALGIYGGRIALTSVNAFRFMMSTGNISTGTFNLYGVTY